LIRFLFDFAWIESAFLCLLCWNCARCLNACFVLLWFCYVTYVAYTMRIRKWLGPEVEGESVAFSISSSLLTIRNIKGFFFTVSWAKLLSSSIYLVTNKLLSYNLWTISCTEVGCEWLNGEDLIFLFTYWLPNTWSYSKGHGNLVIMAKGIN